MSEFDKILWSLANSVRQDPDVGGLCNDELEPIIKNASKKLSKNYITYSDLTALIEGMKMNVNKEMIYDLEDEEVAPRVLKHNETYNSAISDIISYIKEGK